MPFQQFVGHPFPGTWFELGILEVSTEGRRRKKLMLTGETLRNKTGAAPGQTLCKLSINTCHGQWNPPGQLSGHVDDNELRGEEAVNADAVVGPNVSIVSSH